MSRSQQSWRKEVSGSIASFAQQIADEWGGDEVLESIGVFADWLEDRGDASAAFVRQLPAGQVFSIAEYEEVTEYYEGGESDTSEEPLYYPAVVHRSMDELVELITNSSYRYVEDDMFLASGGQSDSGGLVEFRMHVRMIGGHYMPGSIRAILFRLAGLS